LILFNFIIFILIIIKIQEFFILISNFIFIFEFLLINIIVFFMNKI